VFNFACNYKVQTEKNSHFISRYTYISVQIHKVNHAAASGLYDTPLCTQNYMIKGNMAYEDRKIRVNTMGTKTIGIEDKETILHNFKM
jgi:hypothetical protein